MLDSPTQKATMSVLRRIGDIAGHLESFLRFDGLARCSVRQEKNLIPELFFEGGSELHVRPIRAALSLSRPIYKPRQDFRDTRIAASDHALRHRLPSLPPRPCD